MRIALVNCAVLPEPDPDEAPLLAGLGSGGHDARTLAWDGPENDPSGFDLAVLRATWNYHERPDEFLDWCDRAGRVTRLLNPAPVVRWNAHKRYLLELETAGVPIVPTIVLPRQSASAAGQTLPELCAARGWLELVVKPAVSCGSFGTRRFDADQLDEASAFLHDLRSQRDVMVQPYLRSVEAGGERALVWVDGVFTHAIEKAPRFDNEVEHVTARESLTDDERAFGERVIRAAGKDVLYARVDVMDLDDGTIALSELELIEPSLFFEHSAAAVDRFVRAVDRFASPTPA